MSPLENINQDAHIIKDGKTNDFSEESDKGCTRNSSQQDKADGICGLDERNHKTNSYLCTSATLDKMKCIGQGSHAIVFRGVFCSGTDLCVPCAIKWFHDNDQDTLTGAHKEYSLLGKLSYKPLFLNCYGIYMKNQLKELEKETDPINCPLEKVALRPYGSHDSDFVTYELGRQLIYPPHPKGNTPGSFGSFGDEYQMKHGGSLRDENSIFLILEIAENGSLADFSSRFPHLVTRKFVLSVCIQLACILDTLSKENIVHLDIKPHNIFVMKDLSIRLGDMNYSVHLNDDEHVFEDIFPGTQVYSPPELLLSSKNMSGDELRYCLRTADIYSFGVVVWTLITGRQPYFALKTPVQRLVAIKKGFFECRHNEWSPTLNGRLALPSGEKLKDANGLMSMVESCVSKNSRNRPSPKHILRLFEQQLQ